MASIIMKRGTTSEISNTPISDGQILFETDTKNIYIDEGSNRIEYRATTIDIDSELRTTSENPVQNKVITTNINDINTKLNSINPQADSGYAIIGDTLIQWGTAIYDTRGNNNYIQTNIFFPMSFADSNYTVSLTLNYPILVSAYHDAIAGYATKTQNNFQARAVSKSGGFTTTNFPTNDISVNWLAIGKRAL